MTSKHSRQSLRPSAGGMMISNLLTKLHVSRARTNGSLRIVTP